MKLSVQPVAEESWVPLMEDPCSRCIIIPATVCHEPFQGVGSSGSHLSVPKAPVWMQSMYRFAELYQSTV